MWGMQVVDEAKRKAGEPVEQTEFEKREALEAEMPGYAGIKHHVTQDEITRRRHNLQQNTLREADDLHVRSSASFEHPYRPSVDSNAPLFDGAGSGAAAQDHMENGTGPHHVTR